MKQIQWFPGHMFKSIREIKEKIKLMDLVLVLLDARLPQSSMNPEIAKIIQTKPTLILFNKMDLADESLTQKWMRHYQQLGFHTLKIDAQSGKNVKKIETMTQTILKDKIDTLKRKGLKIKPFKTMILGIPNVGKSTLINRLSDTKAAKTGNTPGVTKAQQWIKLSDTFELLDTPGILWPKFDDEQTGYHLAITGAIKDHILPMDDVVSYAYHFMMTHYKKALYKRYHITDEAMSYPAFLDHVGRQRGALSKQGEIDVDRVYQIILTDIRSHQLGGITFDRI